MNKYEKVYIYTIAGICGIAGFTLTYITLGWLSQPVQEWINKKFE